MAAVMDVLDAEMVTVQSELDEAFRVLRDMCARPLDFTPGEIEGATRRVQLAEGGLVWLNKFRTRFTPLAPGVTAVPGPCVGTHRISVVEPFLVVCTGCAWTYLVASEPGVRPTVADAEVAWQQAHR
jgi:hypothetical protein